MCKSPEDPSRTEHDSLSAHASRTLDLLVDDICKRKRFKDLLRTARVIAKVVRNHTLVHAQYTEIGGTVIDEWSDIRQVAAATFALSLNILSAAAGIACPLRRV